MLEFGIIAKQTLWQDGAPVSGPAKGKVNMLRRSGDRRAVFAGHYYFFNNLRMDCSSFR